MLSSNPLSLLSDLAETSRPLVKLFVSANVSGEKPAAKLIPTRSKAADLAASLVEELFIGRLSAGSMTCFPLLKQN